jgi:hypothetical protein
MSGVSLPRKANKYMHVLSMYRRKSSSPSTPTTYYHSMEGNSIKNEALIGLGTTVAEEIDGMNI